MDTNGDQKPGRYLSPFFRALLKIKVWLVDRLRLGDRQLTLIWAALIGLLGALAAESFRRASDIVHFLVTGSESEIISSFAKLPLWQRVVVPTAGGFLAGLILWLGNRLTGRLHTLISSRYGCHIPRPTVSTHR